MRVPGWRLAVALACAGLGLPLPAAATEATPFRPEESDAERDAVASVHLALEHRDCRRAAAKLNEGLRERYTGIYLLAGAMYENGLCLKPDWDRAQAMYLRAQEGGHRGGGLRLVAGAAAPVPGAGPGARDPGLALWWAQQLLAAVLPEPCRVPEFVHRDAEAYALTLQRWPAGRLQHCIYVAGAVAAAVADLSFPQEAAAMQLTGEVEMRFTPARGTLEWKTVSLEATDSIGVRNQDAGERRLTRRGRETFERHMRALGDRALQRYPRPEGIPEDWGVVSTYSFTLR